MNAVPAKKPASARPIPRKQAAGKAVARKAPAKPAAKPSAKPATRPAAAPAEKPRKAKLVRDSFTIPKAEYAAIDALKQRAVQAGRAVKKSELLRAGLMALTAMATPAFLAALQTVPSIKTGRPAKG